WTKAAPAPGRTSCGRALPPISESSECAKVVFPAPVSPVITLRPPVNRSSARSISSKFSMRSSWSTQPLLAMGRDGLARLLSGDGLGRRLAVALDDEVARADQRESQG